AAPHRRPTTVPTSIAPPHRSKGANRVTLSAPAPMKRVPRPILSLAGLTPLFSRCLEKALASAVLVADLLQARTHEAPQRARRKLQSELSEAAPAASPSKAASRAALLPAIPEAPRGEGADPLQTFFGLFCFITHSPFAHYCSTLSSSFSPTHLLHHLE